MWICVCLCVFVCVFVCVCVCVIIAAVVVVAVTIVVIVIVVIVIVVVICLWVVVPPLNIHVIADGARAPALPDTPSCMVDPWLGEFSYTYTHTNAPL